MDWKFIFFLTVFTAVAMTLYYRFMMWIAKKAGVSFPTGGFTKLMFDNHTGDVANAGYLYGRHSISFYARKRDGDPGTFEVPLQPGQTLDLHSQALHFSGSITFRGIPDS